MGPAHHRFEAFSCFWVVEHSNWSTAFLQNVYAYYSFNLHPRDWCCNTDFAYDFYALLHIAVLKDGFTRRALCFHHHIIIGITHLFFKKKKKKCSSTSNTSPSSQTSTASLSHLSLPFTIPYNTVKQFLINLILRVGRTPRSQR